MSSITQIIKRIISFLYYLLVKLATIINILSALIIVLFIVIILPKINNITNSLLLIKDTLTAIQSQSVPCINSINKQKLLNSITQSNNDIHTLINYPIIGSYINSIFKDIIPLFEQNYTAIKDIPLCG